MIHIRKICVSVMLYYTYILNADVNVTKIEYDGDNIAGGIIFLLFGTNLILKTNKL